jgi:signal peptidase II
MTDDASNPQSAIRNPQSTNPFRSPSALARFFLTAAIGVGVDLVTKVRAFSDLYVTHWDGPDGRRHFESTTYEFIPGWLHFKLTANYGAVFGIGQGQRYVFLAFSVGAILFLVYLFRASGRQRFYQVVLGMLLAGVVGNMYDRTKFGYVRDMIYALPGRTWPGSDREIFPWIFNVADSLLCVGVGLMLIYSFFAPRRTPGQEGPSSLAAAGPTATPTERAVL